VRASQRTDLGLAIYANSITLTPGTISLDVREGTILVHALTRSSGEGLQSGEMDRRVSWLEAREETRA
jgi:multicomponent Na+:H+ antiporter subunit E